MECDIRLAWIIKLLIFFRVASVSAIVLAKGPEDKTVYEGDTVTFECIVANKGTSNILWVYNGKRFISAGTVVFSHISERNGLNRRSTIISSVSGQYKLKIFNVSKSDEGLFACYYNRNQITSSFGTSGTARLRVLDIGTNTPICSVHAPNSFDLHPFQKVVLNCSSASKNFAVKWENGSIAMTKSQYGQQVIEVTLTPFDNGRVFTCREVNPSTYKTQNCSVKPMDILPTADISPRKPEVAVNSDITFMCNASGFPNIAKYSWVHDGHVIAHDLYYPMKYKLIGDGSLLTISGVDMEDNQSTIVCHAFVRSHLYDVASTTMSVKFLPVYLSTNAPTTTRRRTHRTTERTTDLINLQDDGYKHFRAFALSLPAVVASVIAICIFVIVSGGLLMLACNRKPKLLDLPDITARRRRGHGSFIPSVSGGISHHNFIYSELFNDIDLKNKDPPDEYGCQSLNGDYVLEPLLEEKGHSLVFEIHHTAGLVAPPLPPKPSRLIAPDLYTEIPDEVYKRNEQPSPPCDDGILYCGTELSVRSSSETTDMLPEPDEIYYQVPDRTSLVIPEISEYCHSKVTKQWSRTPSPCGCDERSRTTCPSYARVKKGNKGNFGLGNLERRLLIPLKCDDLTSAELYNVNTPLLNFNLQQEPRFKECYTDQIYNAIPEEHAQYHHHNSHTLMLSPRRSFRRCRSRLRRSKSCPKNNPYEAFADDIIHPESFISNLRVAESAPNLINAQLCQTRGRHVYETVPDKVVDKLYKAKSDDILSKGSSDISDNVDSSEYMDMEYVDVSDYI